MQLTRRDALAALAGAGILGGGTAAALARDGFDEERSGDGGAADPDDAIIDALVGTAAVVYPSAVGNVRPFVESYAATKLDRRPEFLAGTAAALEPLDAESRLAFEATYRDLPAVERETVLRRIGADAADPDPEGSSAERVRYYYVNEVLYALYASPTGGELVGIENPPGHPGGTESYQRGSPE